jgi:hypothetical protein
MELGKIAGQALVVVRVGFKREDAPLSSHSMRGEYGVKPDVRAHIEINGARFENHVKALTHMQLIHAGPHLPLDSISQVGFESHTRPRRCHRSVSTHPASKFAEPVH